MNTNELIANALAKNVKFGTANVETSGTDTVVGDGGNDKYKESGDNVLLRMWCSLQCYPSC